MTQKSRMISFRLSAEEYDRLRMACSLAGVENLSEFARAAMNRVIDSADIGEAATHTQLQILRQKLANLAVELDLLNNQIDNRIGRNHSAAASNGTA
jgi:hypothetical protein